MSTISGNVYRNQTIRSVAVAQPRAFHDIQVEIIRKSIHLLIAFVPTLASAIGTQVTIALLGAGILTYTAAEYIRFIGKSVPIISRLTELASRDRDKNRFVLAPITLGLGAMLAVMLYPNPAAMIAVYALAFGDGLASLVGKLFGRIRLPFTGGKSLEGSIGCFIGVLIPTYIVLGDITTAVPVALFASAVEALPANDFDNVILPTLVGAFVMVI